MSEQSIERADTRVSSYRAIATKISTSEYIMSVLCSSAASNISSVLFSTNNARLAWHWDARDIHVMLTFIMRKNNWSFSEIWEVGHIEMHFGQGDFEVLTETDNCEDDGIKDWLIKDAHCPPWALHCQAAKDIIFSWLFIYLTLDNDWVLGAVVTFRSGTFGELWAVRCRQPVVYWVQARTFLVIHNKTQNTDPALVKSPWTRINAVPIQTASMEREIGIFGFYLAQTLFPS